MKRSFAFILAVGVATAGIWAEADNRSVEPVSLPRLWDQLADPDGHKSFHALRQMELDGARAVDFLSDRLETACSPSPEDLNALVKDLGSEDYFTRAAAHQRLLSAGPMALVAIRRARGRALDLEIRRRLDVLQTRALLQHPQTADERRQLAAVRALERIGTPDALGVVRTLASGAPNARLTRWARRASTRLAARLKGDTRGAMAGGDVGRSGFFACEDVRRDPRVTAKLDFGEYRYPATGIVLHDGVAYMGVDHADVGPLICTRIYAIDIETRRVLWRSGDADQTVLDTPAVHEGAVYYCSASDGALHALDAKTGHEKWRVETDRSACSTPVVDGPTVYFGSNDATFHAVDTQFGRPLWTYRGENPMRLPAALSETLALVPSGPDLLALDRRSGKLRWTSSASMLAGAPAVRKGRVFWTSFDEEDRRGKLRAVDLKTGKTLWTHDVRNASPYAPAVDDDTVYALGNDRTSVLALDTATGREKWTARVGKELWFSPVIAGSTVFVAGRTDEKLHAIHAGNGSIRWSLDTHASRASGAPAVADGVVYYGSRRWGLCVITESSADEKSSSLASK